MKHLIILMLVFSLSCKKKNATPEPDPVPTCKTGTTLFAGKYRYNQEPKDIIEIVFSNNNCPTENSNTYVVKGLAKALTPSLKSGQTMSTGDFTITSRETERAADETNKEFTLLDNGNGVMFINCTKLVNNGTNKNGFIRL